MSKKSPCPAAAPECAPVQSADEALKTLPAADEDHEDQDDDDHCFQAPEFYDPADYRWVPVKRRPRLDGWTEEKQRRFIETLADTGQVRLAAKEVGMTPQTAYKLRRSPHGAAFARAWDAARHHAGAFLEDVAFERVIEGIEHNVYDEYGNVICTRRAYDNRLLTFLLRHLKPERYARDALATLAPQPETLESSLREMEPQLPAPAEELMDEGMAGHELLLAEIGDGKLPHLYSEQRPQKTEAQLKAEADIARWERGKAVSERTEGEIGAHHYSDGEFADMCFYIDPISNSEKGRKRFR